MLLKTIEEAKRWIEEHPQTDFGVRFVKKDNTLRAMNCQTGIKDDDILINNPYNKGLDFKKAGLIGVYDTDAKNYRCFDPKRLVAIRIDGVWYGITENQGLYSLVSS